MLAIADELVDTPLTKQEWIERWKEVVDLFGGPYPDICSGKVELNPYGNIVMSPFAGRQHQTRAKWICQFLSLFFPSWTVLENVGVLTGDRVLQPDVLANSQQLSNDNEDDENTPYDTAPEICVEVISASNRRAQVEQKLKNYLESGAQEV
jgi:Uma2 family endonuclease